MKFTGPLVQRKLPKAKGFYLDQHVWTEQTDLVDPFEMHLPFSKQALVCMCLQNKSFENTVGKVWKSLKFVVCEMVKPLPNS